MLAYVIFLLYLCRQICVGHNIKHMKRYLFRVWTAVVALLYVGVMSLEAATISADQAKQIAARFLANQQVQSGAQPLIRRASLRPNELATKVVFDAKDQAGAPYLYAVELANDGGFVLVSGDDRYAGVLGYSDAAFDEQQMPENMRAWLEQYIEEMSYLNSINYTPTLRETELSKSAISPLLTSLWGQSSPFNMYCPQDGNKSSVTGCVATAMAQLINYHIQNHNAPTAIVEAIEGYTTDTRQFVLQGVAAGTALPNKNLLLDSYPTNDENITDAQKAAVATLCYYCGLSVEMDYRSSSSSASSSVVPYALIHNFGFDATTRMVDRADYSYASWMDLVYAELAVARPVYYRGSSSGGGHAFIVDGYDGNGLFHVNWGWVGSCNGYFALSVMNSDDDGQIGASASWDGYNIGQQAIIGTQINTGQTYTQPICLSATIKGVDTEDLSVNFSIYNMTGETHTFEYSLGIVNNDGSLTPIGNTYTTAELQNRYGYSSRYLNLYLNESYANTTQKISVISRELDTNTWYAGTNTELQYVTVSYNAYGVPTNLVVHPITSLAVSTFDVPTTKFANEKQTVRLTFTNNADEFYGTLYLFDGTMEDNEEVAVARFGLTVLAGETQTVLMPWTPAAAGTYNLRLATDKYCNNIIGSANVTITEDASLAGKSIVITELLLDELDITSCQVNPDGTRSYDVYKDSICGSIRIRNISGNTFSNLALIIKIEQFNEQTQQFMPDSYSRYYSWSSYAPNATTKLNIARGQFQIGKTYRLAIVERNTNPTHYFDDRFIVHLREHETPEPGTAIENVAQKNEAQKILENGQIIILKNGVRYNVQGQVIR